MNQNDYPGLLVTVEGIDGAGKSTVVDALREEYKKTVTTSEPSECWTGKQVYRAISSANNDDAHPVTTFFLFMADRNQHIQDLIQPSLEDGMMVISDRYSDSTFAYQQHALRETIDNPIEFARETMEQWSIEPDITIFIDVPVDVAVERAEGKDEYENTEFLSRVRENYHDLIEDDPDRWEVVDGTQPKAEVREEVIDIIERRKPEGLGDSTGL